MHDPNPIPLSSLIVGIQDQLTAAYTTMAYVTQPASVAPAGEAWRTEMDSLLEMEAMLAPQVRTPII